MAQKITGDQISGILAMRAIPYDGTKTSAVTTIDTGIKFGSLKLMLHYRCYNVSVTTPGAYNLITTVDFTSVFANSSATSSVVDYWVAGRFGPGSDFFVMGGDAAGSQRLSGKISYANRLVEVWGQFGGATTAYGVASILTLV